ncbi:homeobox protein knotted-1-like 7-like protein [Corchorus capsularis]|uniref:Homeobox protein knotted-1-like 7-like protein n=1 Tax=Corchorus capsularis TaxID=210143 RepID=A0A1R3GYF7_COCAP|nr:homeobox protein knotted-1-like 7-like protein [Corchorus capsularis]
MAVGYNNVDVNAAVGNAPGFKSRIEDVKGNFVKRRKDGKLPGDTITVPKNWWQQQSEWPYPTAALAESSKVIVAQDYSGVSTREKRE